MADVESQLEEKHDQAEAAGIIRGVMTWVNAVVGADHDAIAEPTFKDLHTSLKDGVVLCKLINKLLQAKGKAEVSFQTDVPSLDVAKGNIKNFNKGCIDYGLNKKFILQGEDVWEGRKGPFLNVIRCLHNLGTLANENDYSVKYNFQPPNMDQQVIM